MPDAYDSILTLASPSSHEVDARRALRDFARYLGWRPSYPLLDHNPSKDIARAHLVVEHGLQSSAVLSFINESVRTYDFDISTYNRLLSISYNNLVDWHLCIETDGATLCNNRIQPAIVSKIPLSRTTIDSLQQFNVQESLIPPKVPLLPNIEDALVRLISKWKRVLSSESPGKIDNFGLSNLFNSLIFIRTIEDQRSINSESLAMSWRSTSDLDRQLSRIIAKRVQQLGLSSQDFISIQALMQFDSCQASLIDELILDFYRNPFAPYEYNFSLLSKHALGRIYEHYSSLLHYEDEFSPQLSFFPPIPNEIANRSQGVVYTPEFISRFFARIIRDQLPPSIFRNMATIDPAWAPEYFSETYSNFSATRFKTVSHRIQFSTPSTIVMVSTWIQAPSQHLGSP